MPGGKGPASPSDGDGLVSGNLGLIALFGGVVLVFGGIVAANQAGLFGGSSSTASGDILGCEETFTGSSVHEHAQFNFYLNSSETFDFSQSQYQVADPRLHFEHGSQDGPPGGATLHIHEGRPTIACLFQTLGWSVSPDSVTISGETYAADASHEWRVFVDGEADDRGFNAPLEGQKTYTVRYLYTDSADGGTSNSST